MAIAHTLETINAVLSAFVLNNSNAKKTAMAMKVSRNFMAKIIKEYHFDTELQVYVPNPKPPKLPKPPRPPKIKIPKVKPVKPIFKPTKESVLPDVIRDSTMDPEVINDRLACVEKANNAKLSFIEKGFIAKEKLIDQILDIAEFETNMHNLQEAIKTLHAITEPKADDPGQKPTAQISYLQIINNNLIQAGYGIKSPNRIEEDQQEPSGDN